MDKRVYISKSGLSCMWEQGGSWTNTGCSLLIGDNYGLKKKPIHIRTSGHLACDTHALIPIVVGDTMVTVDRHRDDYIIAVWEFTSIIGDSFQADKVNMFSDGEWDRPLLHKHNAIVEMAKFKSCEYHCRYPVYVKEDK